MRVPEGYVRKRAGPVLVIAHEEVAGEVEEQGILEIRNPARWKGAAGTLSGGRAAPVRVALENRTLVVKQVLRGGVVSWVNRELHLGAQRIYQEAHLSNQLLSRGVPAARMLLGRAESSAFVFFRLHMGSEEVKDSKNLLELLTAEAVNADRMIRIMRQAGDSIRRLHDAGIRHHDLNFSNLLAVRPLDESRSVEVKIIDLDRSSLHHAVNDGARTGNLARLYRHAVKNGLERGEVLDRFWTALLEGYCGGIDGVERLAAMVERRFQSSHFFHRLSWRMQGR